MKAGIRLYLSAAAALDALGRRARQAWRCERGDVTSTVIIIAVLVAAAVAAGVVISSFISNQTDKIG